MSDQHLRGVPPLRRAAGLKQHRTASRRHGAQRILNEQFIEFFDTDLIEARFAK